VQPKTETCTERKPTPVETLVPDVAEGFIARFDFELSTKPPSGDGLGFGRFIAIPGSDSSALLCNLKTTLAAKELSAASARVSAPFAFVLLGNDLSHATDGGMSRRTDSNENIHWAGEDCRGASEFQYNTSPRRILDGNE
jgi:hypothetical protein